MTGPNLWNLIPTSRVAGFGLKNLSHPIRPTNAKKKKPKLPRSGNFLVFLSSNPVTFAQIHSNPAKIYFPSLSNLLKSNNIWLDLTQISSNSTKLGSNLLKSSDIPLDPAPST